MAGSSETSTRSATGGPTRSSYRRTATRGGLLSSAGHVISQAVMFGAYIALARLVTPTELGIFTAGSLISNIGLLFAESGMLGALITRRERIEEAANTAVVWSIVSGGGLALAALAVSPLVGVLFGDARIGGVSAALSGVLWLRALSTVPDALLQRRLSFVRRVAVDPFEAIAFAGVAIVATRAGAGVWGLVLGVYASMSARTISTWALLRWRPRPRTASLAMWRELIRFSRSLVLSECIRRAVESLDVVIIGRFVGVAALGRYRYAQRVAGQPLSTWVSVGAYVLLPVLALLSDDLPRLRAACLMVLRWMAIGLFPAALLLSALGPSLVTLVFGREWRQAGWAVMALGGFSIGHAVISVASEAFKAVWRPGELPRMHAVSGVASVVCMLSLLPFGMLGVAAGVSLAACISGGYAIARLRTVVGVPVEAVLRAFAAPLGAALIVAILGFVLDSALLHADRHPTLQGLAILAGEALGLVLLYLLMLAAVAPDLRAALGAAARRVSRSGRR